MSVLRKATKRLAAGLGYTITRRYGESSEIKGYVGEEIMEAARKAGLPLWDYYDTLWQPACSFEDMVTKYLKPLLGRRLCVVEIGTGAGRLAARILKHLDVATFYSFEPSAVLCKYLRDNLPVTEMRVSGHSLGGVDDESSDLVAAAGVFTYLPTSTVFNYLDESARVLKRGGVLYFDILDTDNYSRSLFSAVQSYARQGHDRPLLSARFVKRYLRDLGFSSLEPSPPPGISDGGYGGQYLIFRKD